MKQFINKNFKLLLAMLCALLLACAGLCCMTLNIANAAEETDDLSEYFSPGFVEIDESELPNLRSVQVGEDLSGKTVYMNCKFLHCLDTENSTFTFENYYVDFSDQNIGSDTESAGLVFLQKNVGPMKNIFSYMKTDVETVHAVDSHYYSVTMPDDLGIITEIDLKYTVPVDYPANEGTIIKVEDPNNVTDGDQTENPSIGDWFNNLGNTISDWLNENVGIAVSGSAVLIIGGIILFFIIFRKRR